MKEKEQTSIAIVVSLDGSSKSALKIVMAHTDGSEVTVTKWADGTRGGMNYIPNRVLRQMFETSGAKAIVATMESGNDHR